MEEQNGRAAVCKSTANNKNSETVARAEHLCFHGKEYKTQVNNFRYPKMFRSLNGRLHDSH